MLENHAIFSFLSHFSKEYLSFYLINNLKSPTTPVFYYLYLKVYSLFRNLIITPPCLIITPSAICRSISPGNVMTPLWEDLAGQTPDAAATIKMGENAQVSSQRRTQGFLHKDRNDMFEEEVMK